MDRLYNEINELPFNANITWNQLCATISNSAEISNIIYLLIIHHHYKETGKLIDKPYNIRPISKDTNGVLVQLNDLPDNLKIMLNKLINKLL